MSLQGAIFDFNGTLVWDSPLHEAAWREFSSDIRGYELTDEELQTEVHGRINRHILEYLTGRQLDLEEVRVLAAQKEQSYRTMALDLGEQFCLSPGAEKLLNDLVSASRPITIATASDSNNLEFFMDSLKLSRWFDFNKIVYDDGSFPGKPAPDIFLRAAAKLSLPPDKCVVIEDSLAGLESARKFA